MDVKLDNTINYDTKQSENSSYGWTKIVPLSGNQTVSAGNEVQFELPVQAWNLAKSYFSATLTVPAQGAGNFSWVHRGLAYWSSAQLFTRSGTYLLNLQEKCTDYSRVVISADSTTDELEHGDESGPLYVEGDTKSLIGGSGANGSTAAPYRQQSYLSVSGDNAAQTIQIKFPMKALKRTIMALDKSILFREVLVLRLKMAPIGDIGYLGTSATNTDTGATDLTGAVQFTNVAFYAAQEKSASVVEALNAATGSPQGMSFVVEYPTTYTNSRSGTQQNITLRINKFAGSSLVAVKNTVFSGGSYNARYDRDTDGDAIVSSYYTNINNNRLQQFEVDISAGDAYMLHKERLHNTPALNQTIYKENWFHEDRFDNGNRSKDDGEVDENVYAGIDLSQEVRYDLYATTANATHTHFSIVHALKILNINANGIVIA
jgi:hypothetical protein